MATVVSLALPRKYRLDLLRPPELSVGVVVLDVRRQTLMSQDNCPKEAWVVFDGTEPDSKVIGLALTLEDVLMTIASRVTVDRKTLRIELPYSDAGSIKAGDREWAIQKERLRG